MKKIFLIFALLAPMLFGCNDNPDDNTLNIFSVEDDISLGQQTSEEINNSPAEFPILDEGQYPEAYAHLHRIRDNILNSGKVFYKDRFTWEMKIIHDDDVLNAFAAPGGYIYVYTGLIKFLEAEDQFAGVLAHEIAHADRRHVTDQLTKIYGIQFMLDVVLGTDQNAISDIAAQLAQLKFSRSAESDADEYSVIYLCPTELEADGAADFFRRMDDSQRPPEFLSTHPNPENRVEKIEEKEQELGCTGTEEHVQRYQDFKNSLP
ncbi:MAG: M48 family metalloprotease [Bacteroidia bacterium]